ncbi:MAG: Endonuclease V, partial [uncultured Rubrobacteraceae bacterium]
EGTGTARSGSLAVRSKPSSGGARPRGSGGSGVGSHRDKPRRRGRRLYRGGQGLRDGRRPGLPRSLSRRGAGGRDGALFSLRTGSALFQGDTGRGGRSREGPDAGGRRDLRRPGPRPPAPDGPRLAPRALSGRSISRVRQDPPGRRPRGARNGEGRCHRPRPPRRGHRPGAQDAQGCLARLRLRRQRHRSAERRRSGTRLLPEVSSAGDHPPRPQRREPPASRRAPGRGAFL